MCTDHMGLKQLGTGEKGKIQYYKVVHPPDPCITDA